MENMRCICCLKLKNHIFILSSKLSYIIDVYCSLVALMVTFGFFIVLIGNIWSFLIFCP